MFDLNVIDDLDLRVLHVVTDFPYLREGKIYNYGGLGLCVMQLIDGLISAGCKVDVIAKNEKLVYDLIKFFKVLQ